MSEDDPCALRSDDEEPYNMRLHVAAVFVEIGVSFLGTALPLISRRCCANTKQTTAATWMNLMFALAKNFGTGVILATALVHMLCPAMQALTHECLPPAFHEDTGYAAFAGLLALGACLTIQFIQSLAMQRARAAAKQHAKLGSQHQIQVVTPPPPETLQQPLLAHQEGTTGTPAPATPSDEVHHHDEDNDMHGHTLLLDRESSRKVSTYMLELGIATHSVIIGITLGVARGDTFTGLLIALAFHQFFEGIALSTTVLDSGFKTLAQPVLVVVFYTLTTPVGIAIGIALSRTYNENSVAALLVQGSFDAVSAGILLYDGLVNMLTTNITNSKEFATRSTPAKIFLFVALWLGAAIMAIIGRWA